MPIKSDALATIAAQFRMRPETLALFNAELENARKRHPIPAGNFTRLCRQPANIAAALVAATPDGAKDYDVIHACIVMMVLACRILEEGDPTGFYTGEVRDMPTTDLDALQREVFDR